jgi:hypothetical protein
MKRASLIRSSRPSKWKFLVWSLNVPYAAESLHNELLVILWAVARPNQTTSSTPVLHEIFNFMDNVALVSSDEDLLSTLPFTMKDFEPNLCFREKHIHNKNLQTIITSMMYLILCIDVLRTCILLHCVYQEPFFNCPLDGRIHWTIY